MFQDPEIETAPRNVSWHDLTDMPVWQRWIELTLPLPWLALSLALYASPWWMLGPLASFMFFLCALRLNHEAIHGNLGLSRRADAWVKHVLSALMLGSNHADAFCHLRHHKFNMSAEDHEGHCAHMGLWQVLAYGPRFPVDLNRATWRHGGPRWRRRMLVDWALIVGVVVICVALGWRFLLLHLAAMAVAQCLTAFFAYTLSLHDALPI